MLDDFFLKSAHILVEYFSIARSARIITGTVDIQSNPKTTFLLIIMKRTPMIVAIPGINVVTADENTCCNELTSPVILAKILPVGLESKNVKASV